MIRYRSRKVKVRWLRSVPHGTTSDRVTGAGPTSYPA
jgi:hypothetical protein